jgi:hypothetical protein
MTRPLHLCSGTYSPAPRVCLWRDKKWRVWSVFVALQRVWVANPRFLEQVQFEMEFYRKLSLLCHCTRNLKRRASISYWQVPFSIQGGNVTSGLVHHVTSWRKPRVPYSWMGFICGDKQLGVNVVIHYEEAKIFEVKSRPLRFRLLEEVARLTTFMETKSKGQCGHSPYCRAPDLQPTTT